MDRKFERKWKSKQFLIFKNQKLPFYFTAFVKVENLKKEWLNIGQDSEEDESLGLGIISNPKKHHIRKLSAGEKEKDYSEKINKSKHIFSKFDEYDPFFNKQGSLLNQLKYGVPSGPTILPNSSNKFDLTYDYKEQQQSVQKNEGKRPKSHSIHYLKKTDTNKKSSKLLPLNKDYQFCGESIYFNIYWYLF